MKSITLNDEEGAILTVQDFIVIYNETFIYLHKTYGKSEVVKLWQKLSQEFTYKLQKLVEQKGLKGIYEFFYGDEGTAGREHVIGDRYCNEHEFFERVRNCPSVSELINRKRDVYRYYCEHCYWLYAYAIEKYGYKYDIIYNLQEKGKESKSCYDMALPHDRVNDL